LGVLNLKYFKIFVLGNKDIWMLRAHETHENAIHENAIIVPSNAGDMITHQIMLQTSMNNQRHRSKSTNTQYDPKVAEYKSWCDEVYGLNPVETRYTVNEAKLVAFLQMKVIGRKQKNGDQEIGISTVKAYRNAVVDLYKTQRSQNVNNYDHPGEGKTLKDLMKSLKRDKADICSEIL
jgi:hypothetical protein